MAITEEELKALLKYPWEQTEEDKEILSKLSLDNSKAKVTDEKTKI